MAARPPPSARTLAALGAGLLAFWCPRANADPTPLELAVKATYLYKLAPFVSWPASAFAAPEAPLTICVQGADPFGPLIDRAVNGQSAAGRPIVVRRTPQVAAGLGCHIAYLAGGPAQSVPDALRALDRTPTLTVTDAARGSARGVVHLLVEGGRVRFAVDAALARADDVALSSKLMALAVEVRP